MALIEAGRISSMSVQNEEIYVKSTGRTDIVDITPQVTSVLKESSVKNGTVTLFIPGSTAALTTIEFESGVVNDLKKAIDRMAPEEMYYEHNEKWGDGNGFSHVRAALIGPSLHIPVVDGKMTLGTWQQIVLLDFDNRPRKRRILVQTSGE
jgi:secondary thiamine-phosphate synthase enzyme